MVEHTVQINCTQEHLFNIYKSVESWPAWDPDIEAAHLDGEFRPGASGWIKPSGAPKTPTQIVEVNEPHSFTVESRLPLCVMRFEHDIKPVDGSLSVTHRMKFSGLLSPVFSRLIGSKVARTIDHTMQSLKQYAEKDG